MSDIAPELLQKLQAAFRNNLTADENGKNLLKILENGGTYEQAGDYAETVGNALVKALRENLSSADLPDGKMYWNLAQNVIDPLLREDHKLCTEAVKLAQNNINQALGVKIKPQVAEYNTDRANAILNKISNAEQYDDVAESLERAVPTFSRGVVDDSVKKNAEFHSKSGLQPLIVRKSSGSCCEWCTKMVGKYRYPDEVPKDVYRRHDNCRCSVDYLPDKHSKVKQNVHSKQWNDEASVTERKQTGLIQQADSKTLETRKTYGSLDENGHRIVDNKAENDIIKSEKIEIQKQEIADLFRLKDPKQVSIPAVKIDTSKLVFHDEHAARHGCTLDQAVSYVENSKFSITRHRWDGISTNFYSNDGATYVDEFNKIKTAFSCNDFDEVTKKAMEIVE